MPKSLRSLIFFISLLHLQAAFSVSPVSAKHGMVVSEQHLASQVGVDILRAGGNAVDAAVAVGYALAVVNPCCGNIGGGGFMLIRLKQGNIIFINFRERAPLAATPTLYQDKNGNVIPDKSTDGYLAVATPGSVMGLNTALKKYGSMSRQQVMAPAIKLAEAGYKLMPDDITILNSHVHDFEKSPNIAKIFLNNGQPYQAGDKLVQKDLAKTLKIISASGTDAFYHGKIAETIVKASQQNGGILTKKDFADYKIEILNPLRCQYHDYSIISSPPPSSGGVTLCEMLNILEGYSLTNHSPDSIHQIIEAMRFAFADRNSKLGDPDFVTNPIDKLISKNYAAGIRSRIPANHPVDSNDLYSKKMLKEGVDTTHFSVVDKWGNAVSVTTTLNSFFGAQVIAGGTGFFLNDEMDDFTAKSGVANKFGLVEGNENDIEPGKRPLSSMMPTIITKNGKTVLVMGSPGGPRIITAILETLLNTLDYNMNLQEAVNAPRFHHQWLPDVVYYEPDAFSDVTLKKLTAMGYHFVAAPRPWGAVESIYIDNKSGTLYGANDIRRSAGAAMGY